MENPTQSTSFSGPALSHLPLSRGPSPLYPRGPPTQQQTPADPAFPPGPAPFPPPSPLAQQPQNTRPAPASPGPAVSIALFLPRPPFTQQTRNHLAENPGEPSYPSARRDPRPSSLNHPLRPFFPHPDPPQPPPCPSYPCTPAPPEQSICSAVAAPPRRASATENPRKSFSLCPSIVLNRCLDPGRRQSPGVRRDPSLVSSLRRRIFPTAGGPRATLTFFPASQLTCASIQGAQKPGGAIPHPDRELRHALPPEPRRRPRYTGAPPVSRAR